MIKKIIKITVIIYIFLYILSILDSIISSESWLHFNENSAIILNNSSDKINITDELWIINNVPMNWVTKLTICTNHIKNWKCVIDFTINKNNNKIFNFQDYLYSSSYSWEKIINGSWILNVNKEVKINNTIKLFPFFTKIHNSKYNYKIQIN